MGSLINIFACTERHWVHPPLQGFASSSSPPLSPAPGAGPDTQKGAESKFSSSVGFCTCRWRLCSDLKKNGKARSLHLAQTLSSAHEAAEKIALKQIHTERHRPAEKGWVVYMGLIF